MPRPGTRGCEAEGRAVRGMMVLGLGGRTVLPPAAALELVRVVTTGELMQVVVAVLVMQVLTDGCRIPAGFSPTWRWIIIIRIVVAVRVMQVLTDGCSIPAVFIV
jgi:hypothetical protein